MNKKSLLLLFLLSWLSYAHAQEKKFDFRIRTITAGVTLKDLSDTITLKQAIIFLRQAKKTFTDAGYEVQTLRIATANLYSYIGNGSLMEAIPFLIAIDKIAVDNGISLSVGQILPPNQYQAGIGQWAAALVSNTKSISFNLSISSHALKIHQQSIKASAEIVRTLAALEGGEANFRFTAMANCPANIPFFPAAFHEGVNSFAIGLESPNLLTDAFLKSRGDDTRDFLKAHLEKNLRLVEMLAESIGRSANWTYDGIDVSPAPGLDGFEPGIGIDGLEDIRNRKSILSGDLQNNDGGEIFNDNAFHVVTTFGVGIEGGPLTVLDGFLIADGNANGGGTNEWGGGMFNTGSGLTISNCDFRYNKGASGAAVTNQNSSPIFNNCTFSLNTATSNGGAIFNLSSAPKLNNCAVFNNTAGTYGGGIYNSGSSPIFTNSSIAANAANAGGGVSNKAFSNPSFINCVFEGNAASAAGGAVENDQANPVFTNSTFTGNSSTGSGGAIRNYQANPVITNSIFWNNTGANAPEIDDNYLSTSNVTYSIVKGGFAGTGNVDLDPVFGTGVNLTACSPAVDAGSNAAVPAGVLKDINGNNRIINTTVDMGALEFSSATTYTYYRDADGDTFGSNTLSKTSFCETPPTGWITRSEDCDDGNAGVNPGMVEICDNQIDDNCDGQIDEDCGGGGGCELEGPLYRDEDGDGFGNPNWILANPACDNYYGYVLDNTDCNDDDATINPNAVEICGNGIDDNCNGLVDENCDPCGVFSNLTTTNISSTSATLNWSASTNPDQWQVQYKSTSKGSKWIDVPNVGPAARSVTITNLSRNQNYSWHIRAKCGKVMTKYSASIEFRTAQNSNTSAALAVNTQKEQVAQASALVVYPSPASHQFSIRINLGTTVAAPVAIQLFDMNGKMVLNQSAGLVSGILQKQLTLPSSLSNGLYLVRITADGKVFNRKLIVNK